MDEPFSGLDPLIRREMQDELLRLQKELQKTIVFVTHDLNEALRLGDRMAVMNQGRFVQIGAPREIMRHPANEYVQRFVQGEGKIDDLAKNKTGPELHQESSLHKKTREKVLIGSY